MLLFLLSASRFSPLDNRRQATRTSKLADWRARLSFEYRGLPLLLFILGTRVPEELATLCFDFPWNLFGLRKAVSFGGQLFGKAANKEGHDTHDEEIRNFLVDAL